jgi:hypothetical protein
MHVLTVMRIEPPKKEAAPRRASARRNKSKHAGEGVCVHKENQGKHIISLVFTS